VPLPARNDERLQKVLAAAGVASRRESEQLILEGRVEVDGAVVTELGTRVNPATQEIRVDGETLTRPRLVYYAVHKPAGVVSTAKDPSGRPRVIDLLPPSVGRVFNVGRLDLESEGLILVTNDGELAQQLTHPSHGVEKTYAVQVAGHVTPEILEQLRKGVHLAEGFVRVVNVQLKSRRKNSSLLEIVLDEGRNREIRRLLARLGHKVQRLTRIAVGRVRLGQLPRGAYRPLTPVEIRNLQAATDPGHSTDSKRASTKSRRKKHRPRPASATAKKMPRAAAQTTQRRSATVIGGDTLDAEAESNTGSAAAKPKPKRPVRGAAGRAAKRSPTGAESGQTTGKRKTHKRVTTGRGGAQPTTSKSQRRKRR
jgi:23S rRNA pseudouridine2605 synthase